MTVEFAGAPDGATLRRGWLFAPAALLLLALGAAVAALPRAELAPAWRATVAAWVGPLAPHAGPDDGFAPARLEPAALAAGGADDLLRAFRDGGYTLAAVREGDGAVPRVLLPHLPADLATLGSTELRKQAFIKLMLPLLLAENERVLERRQLLAALRERVERGATLDAAALDSLAALAGRYGVDAGDLDELARRIDAVPPSLAIAQAALETGWGTSRAAQRGRNMFGHMEFGAAARTRPFASLADAVEAYAHNLNTHRAYAGFREQRARMRARGHAPDGLELARELGRYSERKADYVRDLRGLIRANDLRPLDRARLDG